MIQDTGNSGEWNWSYDATDDLPTTLVTITATDILGATATQTFQLTVNNVAPALTIDTTAVVINEGTTASKGISASDVPADTVSVTATLGTITADGDDWKIEPVGKVYESLLHDILASDKHAGLGLAEASRPNAPRVPELNPKAKGINLEALTATADGSALLIGLRNPRPNDKAIVLKLTNPAAVVDEGKPAEFGDPVLLDLGGLGIRGMEYSKQHGGYLIAAGHHTTKPQFALYLWSGKADEGKPKKLTFDRPEAFAAETIIVYEGRQEVLLLSDDGTLDVDGKACKHAAPNKRGFKSIWFRVGEK